MKLKYLIVFSFLALILSVGVAFAENETTSVNSTSLAVDGNTFADIQNTVDSSSDNDTVVLDGTYTSSKSPITISKSISVEGNGATLDGGKKSSILNVKSKSLTLKNINFINAKGTPITAKGCNLTIINCSFTDNGGELEYDEYERLYYVSDCSYGAIGLNGGKLTLINSTFSNNVADMCYSIYAKDCDVYLDGNTFSNHNLDYDRLSYNGHIIELEDSRSNITNCIFKDNTVPALFVEYNTFISNCLFDNNYAGITFYGRSSTKLTSEDKLTVVNSTFSKNKEYSIECVWPVRLNVDNCSFINNTNSVILSTESIIFVNNSQFIQNTAKNGSVYNGHGKITFENSRFVENSAKFGGTMYSEGYWDEKDNYDNSLKIINSTIENSSATSDGGAIYGYCCDITLVNTNMTTRQSSKGSPVYIVASSLNSTNSSNVTVTKIAKVKAKVVNYHAASAYYDSGLKRFYIDVVYDDNNPEYYTVMHCTKVMFRVYTGKSYKTYYFNPKYSSSDPYFKYDTSSLSIGKHKVEIIANGKYFTFPKKTTTITIKKAKTTVKAPKVTAKYKKSKYFKATIKHKSTGKVIKGIKVKVKVYTGKKYKTYTLKTDKKGVIKFNTKKFKRGTHKVKFTSMNGKYDVSKTAYFKIK